MARTKRGKLSEKQDDVKRLLEAHRSIEEIAQLMETTPNAIKAQISRINNKGYNLSTENGRLTTTDAEAPSAPVKPPATVTSVEGHIESELERISSRLVTVETDLTNLTTEQGDLTERRERLEQARTSLIGGDRPALAAVA